MFKGRLLEFFEKSKLWYGKEIIEREGVEKLFHFKVQMLQWNLSDEKTSLNRIIIKQKKRNPSQSR